VARPSFEARCGGCGAPKVVPRAAAETALGEDAAATHSWACSCGDFVTAAIQTVKKEAKGLKRGGSLKRKQKRRSALAIRLSKRWGSNVGNVCKNCGRTSAEGARIEGHHVARQQLIKGRGKEAGWTQEELDRRLWDDRNRLDLCSDCHLGKHHNGKKLPWSLVQKAAPKAIQFAREVGLLSRISRDYKGAPK
jgi:hypothetical protein